jgi:hypothetical protein
MVFVPFMVYLSLFMGFVCPLPVSSPVAPPKLYLPQKAGLPLTLLAGMEEGNPLVTLLAGTEEGNPLAGGIWP